MRPSRRTTVAILGYHAVEEGPGPLCIRPAVFQRQVEALRDAGCTALSMADVARHIRTGTPFPDRAVALTFDDGYESVHRTALPILSALGYRATVYPVTSQLGGDNRWDAELGPGRRLRVVSIEALRELAGAGWEVGGHTHTHASLPRLPPRAVAAELADSTAILEDVCGRPVTTFAYPYGHHDRLTRETALERYDACLSIGARRAGLASPLDRLDRIDAWYLQGRWPLRHLHDAGGDAYLMFRRLARRAGQWAGIRG